MTKWIVFNQSTGGFYVEEIEDADRHIQEHTLIEMLIPVDEARALIETLDAEGNSI